MLQDFYRGGQQSGRVAYESVEFNPQIPDKLFNKPASIKEVK
jgi:outer membrane lipoprotein-sorting protein